jgi:hypothetical protein
MKKLVACLMILSLSVFVVGCGKTDEKSPAAKTEPAKTEPAKTEPAKTEMKTEPAKTE